ncbi:lantibiotic dehydratase [Halobacillus litoralis]|uniref:Lanthionine biosynthesis protein n=1 Tax=Halobacillus litoralis TaxID=45668 RepID=A0A410MBW8_9BACI|nr:lantibiotic dehydratase [Halobacillus litoralis]QAS52239.1 lanthionine biosynthesis protein [Halobacillus litoralis]
MESGRRITKNPLVLYRSSGIGKDWYLKLMKASSYLTRLHQDIERLNMDIDLEKQALTSKVEAIFAERKDKKLLNVKRDIHNFRVERMENYHEDTIQSLEGVSLLPFLQMLRQKGKLQKEFEDTYYAVLMENRRILKSETQNENLLKTVLFFNEMIYGKIAKYSAKEVEEHNKKLRKLDFFLVKMMIRSSLKTSPFSYLTKVGSASNAFHVKQQSSVEVNHALAFHMFYGFLRTNAQAIRRIPVQVSNFGTKGSKVYFVSQHSTNNSNKVYETSDKFVEFQLDPQVIDFIQKFKGQELTFDIFRQRLKTLGIYESQEYDLFKKMIELKVFVQKANVGEGRSILKNMIHFLKRYQLNPAFIEDLFSLQSAVDKFEIGTVEERREAWQETKEIADSWTTDDVQFKNEWLFEDVMDPVIEEDRVSPKVTEEWLDCLSQFTLLFDVNVRVQYELAALFKEKYGQRVVPLSESRMLNEVFFSNIHNFYPYYQDIEYRYHQAKAKEVHQLDDLRDRFLLELKAMIDQAEVKELDIKPLMQKYVRMIPADCKTHSEVSITLFAQTSGEKVVVNDIYDGQEKFISRFKDFFEIDNHEYADYISKNYTEKNYYEVDELFGFNGGVHQRVYSKKVNLNVGYHQFNYPDHPSITSFSVKYDEDSRKLRLLDHKGTEAKVAYKSSLVPIFLPGILSVLLTLFQSGRLNFDVNALARKRPVIPRLTYGEVVMYRRRWNLSKETCQPFIESGKEDSDRYQQLHQHFEKRQLPKQFFLKFYKGEGQFTKEKPLFVDLNVPLLFRVFVNECKSAWSKGTDIYIEEALPNAEQDGKEFMVEYTVDQQVTISAGLEGEK